MAWLHLRASVIAEFREVGAMTRWPDQTDGLSIVRAIDLRPVAEVIDLDAYRDELLLQRAARLVRERREEAQRDRRRRRHLTPEAYAAKLARDAKGKRLRRAQDLAPRACRHCGASLALTPRTRRRLYCDNRCKHRYHAAQARPVVRGALARALIAQLEVAPWLSLAELASRIAESSKGSIATKLSAWVGSGVLVRIAGRYAIADKNRLMVKVDQQD